MSNATKIMLQKATAELAARIKPRLTIEAGAVSAPADLYESTLPEGLTMAVVLQTQEHRQLFQAAAKTAVGEVMLDKLLEGGTTNQFNFVTNVGNDNFEMVISKNNNEFDVISGFTVVDHNSEIYNARQLLVERMRNSAAK